MSRTTANHAEFGQGFEDLGDRFFRLALEVGGQGRGVHRDGGQFGSDGSNLFLNAR